MRVAWLEVRDFRCYEELRFEPSEDVNVIVGPNAVGKTALLEAVSFLAALRSFRGVPDEALVRDEADAAVVRAEVAHDAEGVTSLIEVELPRSGRRRAQVNRTRLSRTADLLGHLRVVTFLPEDLDVVKRGPALRRDLLDGLAVQLWPAAYLDQRDYERALRQRNSLLRRFGREADRPTLEVWDGRVADAGARVMARRAAAAQAIGPRLGPLYRRIAPGTADDVVLRYGSPWGGGLDADVTVGSWREALAAALERSREVDLDRRTTTVGPHRDDPWFELSGRDARTRASQGEQRSVMLAVRLASHEAITAQAGEAPVLLLDDVFSELDPGRVAAFAELLPDAQTFVTTAREDDLPHVGRRWAAAHRWKAGEGTIG